MDLLETLISRLGNSDDQIIFHAQNYHLIANATTVDSSLKTFKTLTISIKNKEVVKLKSIENKFFNKDRRNAKTSGNDFLKNHGRRERPNEFVSGSYFDQHPEQFQTANNESNDESVSNNDLFSVNFPQDTMAAKYSNELRKKVEMIQPIKLNRSI